AWSGDQRSFYEVLREYWRKNLFPRQTPAASFDAFWDRSLQDGYWKLQTSSSEPPRFHPDSLNPTVERLTGLAQIKSLSLVLYEKVGMRNGAHAGNPWLQGLPDPISKITWDNYASISHGLARRPAVEEGDIVRIAKGGIWVDLPAHVQPGQH